MKNSFILFLIMAMSMLNYPGFSQPGAQIENDTALLGLPGDNLDLYGVLNVFQKAKTIEDFEKTLNLKETGINNLDLDLNDTVDFIKVVTKQDGNNFTFILQVDVSKNEIQDVGVILVSKGKDGKVSMQIVGDKDLYGKDYVIEPKPATPAATPNPAYTGTDPVTAAAPASTTVVVVESAPIVQYVYSPVYVPYYPPYYYGYYPPYHAAFTITAVSVYHHNNYYHHSGYHGGGYGNTVVIHNENNYNNYNNSRNSSNTVNNNNNNGNYNKNNASTRPSAGTSASPSTNQSRGSSPSTSQSKGSSASPSTSQSKGSATAAKTSTTQSKTSSASRSGSSSGSSSRGTARSGGGRRR